jgi:hypothetical protein
LGESEDKGRRSEPRVWLYTEHWLWGSTRSEYTIDERSVFIDILCLGITGLGKVDITYPEQTAAQLCVPLDVFERTVEKGIKYGKFARKVEKRRKKTFLIILNWRRYQPQYLHEKPTRSTKRGRIAKGAKSDAHVGPIEYSIVEDSKESSAGAHFDLKTEFLKTLGKIQKTYGESPDKDQDERLLTYVLRQHRGLDPLRELRSIEELWKKNPGEVKDRIKAGKSIRTQLYALFDQAAKYAGTK